jgi:hypothetical protein
LFKRRPNSLDRVLAKHDLAEAMLHAEHAGKIPPPVRLEDGTAITAVTDAGLAVSGTVTRIWQTAADARTGAFRVLFTPAGDDSSGEEAAS